MATSPVSVFALPKDSASLLEAEKQGLDSQKFLENRAKNGGVDKNMVGDMQRSYEGYLASHPGTSADAFAAQEASKVGLSKQDVLDMLAKGAHNALQLEQQGLNSQKQLESESKSGGVDEKYGANIDLMQNSYLGYRASHPGTTLDSFAQQEAPKVGLSADQVKSMLSQGPDGWDGPNGLSSSSDGWDGPNGISSSSDGPVTYNGVNYDNSVEALGAQAHDQLLKGGSLDSDQLESLLKRDMRGWLESHPGSTVEQFNGYETQQLEAAGWTQAGMKLMGLTPSTGT